MSDADSSIPAGFRQIPGFPRYAVDEKGTVLSICTNHGGSMPWSKAHRVKLRKNTFGYPFVQLHQDGHSRQVCIHVLVLTVFVGNRPDSMCCRHLDGNPENSHVSNLVWGTQSENYNDSVQHETSCRGDRHGMTKLTKDDVLEIRRRAANGERHSDIAKDFPVSSSNISPIVQRLTWKHV